MTLAKERIRFMRYAIPVKGLWIVLPVLAMLACGCSEEQKFSDVAGNLRISGDLQKNVLSPQTSTLALHLTDASTGYPLDATDVQIKPDNAQAIHAARQQLGSYIVHFTDADRVDVLVITHDRAALIALKRQ